MGFADAVRSGFSNYVTFSGRAVRSEFWYWVLFVLLANIVLGLVDSAFFGGGYGGGGPISAIFGLATLLPGLAVSVRRLHDLDRTGWWVLIWLVPLVGWIVLIIFYATPGTDGPNSHGEDRLTSG